MNRLIKVALLLGVAVVSSGQMAQPNLPLGTVICQTVRASRAYPEPEDHTPWVVVRFLGVGNDRESFALTDARGVALVPLRPGKYCFEAYSDKGEPLELDPEQRKCFELKANEKLNVGVGLKYAGPGSDESRRDKNQDR